MKPFIHAKNSASKYGGKPEDYLPIHEFMDSSKAHIADHRHRALLHSTFGCFMVEKVFGSVKQNSDGKEYSPRDIAEQHCLEDLGHIPTVQDWLGSLPVASWMGGGSNSEIPSRSAIESYKQAKNSANSIRLEAARNLKTELIRRFEQETQHNAIRWCQYTPFFNDGDPCYFSVWDPDVDEKPQDADADWKFDPNDDDCWSDAEYSRHKPGLIDNLAIPIIKSYPEELLQAAFGDHVQVTWIRGASDLEINDYDHD